MRLGLEWKCEVQGGATPSLLILFFLLAQAKHTHSFTNFGGQLHHSRFFFPTCSSQVHPFIHKFWGATPSLPIFFFLLAQAKHTHSFTNFGGQLHHSQFFFPTCSSQAHPFIYKFWGATPSLPIFFPTCSSQAHPFIHKFWGATPSLLIFFSYLLKPNTPIHSQILGGNSITPDVLV